MLHRMINEDIRKAAHIKHVEKFLDKWFGHCLRREQNHIWDKSLRVEVSGRRSLGRPKKSWRDSIKEDMKYCQITEDSTQYWK